MGKHKMSHAKAHTTHKVHKTYKAPKVHKKHHKDPKSVLIAHKIPILQHEGYRHDVAVAIAERYAHPHEKRK
jgi:hypothetical protein